MREKRSGKAFSRCGTVGPFAHAERWQIVRKQLQLLFEVDLS
jgi:hypothetical protein